jgi:hypothetical protein
MTQADPAPTTSSAPRSTHRALLAGAGALGALGVTAASAAPLVPQDAALAGADAELIRLAEQVVAEEAEHQAFVGDDDWEAMNAAGERVFDKVGRLLEMEPRTLLGLQAKARAAWAVGERNPDGTMRSYGTSDDLAWQVVDGVANSMPAPAGALALTAAPAISACC